ncbi:heparinase II/III domain-containing protein [Aeromonas veronii]|uniref:heparinase II/III domain-containing protein n=1 Tax=Aeromonas veronii TaxID=654 RepID=UPI003D1CBF61
MKKYYFTRTIIDGNTLIEADAILHDKEFKLMANMQAIKFETFDYEYPTQSHSLYLHGLRVVAILTDAFSITKEMCYISKALYFIKSWVNFSNNSTHKQLWNDHTVANRSLKLTYFLRECSSFIDDDDLALIERMLIMHADWLYDNSNYNSRGNHGIMQDQALMQIGQYFNKIEYTERAIERAAILFKNSFSKKGVHLENSVFYHFFVTSLFNKFIKFIKSHGVVVNPVLMKTILELENTIISEGGVYSSFLIKPDGNFPLEGDTEQTKFNSSDRSGVFFDSESGKLIIKNDIDKGLYLFFKSGCRNTIHKHCDDLSFELFYDNTDIFIDSGKYNYEPNNPLRKYFVSPKSHNTIFVNNKSYKPSKSDRAFLEYFDRGNYRYARGVNLNYENISLERHIVYLAGVIIILDMAFSENEISIHQNFNLSDNILFDSISKLGMNLKLKTKTASLVQHVAVESFQQFYGDKEQPRGWLSKKFNSCVPLKQIEFKSFGKEPMFLTSINLDIAKTHIENLHYNSKLKLISFTINGIQTEVNITSWYNAGRKRGHFVT